MTRLLTFFLLIMFCYPQQVSAGAWNREKGHGYTQFSFTYLKYDQLLNSGNDNIPLKRAIYDYTLQYYLEYGISDRFNLIVNVPYKFVGSSPGLKDIEKDPFASDTLKNGSLDGFENLTAGFRMNLIKKRYVLSVQLMVSSLMHQYKHETGLQIGYNANTVTPSLLCGRGWERSFIQGEIGVQLRGENYAQNLIGMIEGGAKTKAGKTWFIFQVNWKLPITTGNYEEKNAIQTGLYRDNSAYISPGIKINQKLTKKFSLNLAGYGAVYAKREGAAATLNIGLAYEW